MGEIIQKVRDGLDITREDAQTLVKNLFRLRELAPRYGVRPGELSLQTWAAISVARYGQESTIANHHAKRLLAAIGELREAIDEVR